MTDRGAAAVRMRCSNDGDGDGDERRRAMAMVVRLKWAMATGAGSMKCLWMRVRLLTGATMAMMWVMMGDEDGGRGR